MLLLSGCSSKAGTLSPKSNNSTPIIIAHRGASYDAPEGTRPAYLLARELGVDYLELDLQQTRDNVLVVFHDEDLKAKTDVEEIFPNRKNCRISSFTWNELKQLDAGSWFHEKYPNRSPQLFQDVSPALRLLKLEDVIEIAQQGDHQPGLYIELKYPSKLKVNGRESCARLGQAPTDKFEKTLIETLETAWIKPSKNNSKSGERKVIFQSFEPDSLERLRTLAPDVPRVLLVDEIMAKNHGWDALIQRARSLGVGIGPWGSSWASDPNWSREHAPNPYRAIDPKRDLIGKFHEAGLIVHAWTINDKWEMLEALDSNIDGFFTDRPIRALLVTGRISQEDLDEVMKKAGF